MKKSYHKAGIFTALIFPLFQKNWFSKTWWLVLLAMIPILDLVFLRGWRVQLVHNMAKGYDDILPSPNIIKYFFNGLILWIMTGFYLVIPFIIIFLVGAGELGTFIDISKWAIDSLVSSTAPEKTLSLILQESAVNYSIRITIAFLWLLVSMPIYRIGMIRFAITGRWSCFLNIPLNTFLVIKHIKHFILMWIFGFFLIVFLTIIYTILTATIVLAILAPLVVLMVYYGATGYEFGELGYTLNKSEIDGNKNLQPETDITLSMSSEKN